MRLIRTVAVLSLTAVAGGLALAAADAPATDAAYAAGALHASLARPGSAIAIEAETGTRLRVRAEAVESDQGMIRVALFADADAFDGSADDARPLEVQAVPAAPGRVTAVFDGLSPGRYAVRVLHDENDNGILDRVFGLFTLEGEGVSNDADPERARFDQAAFEVPKTGSVTVDVDLQY
ncbi:hypothetical protein C882_1796 [Caenispirillum salinarum AK4]|uniref:DUF2141 domain-containing protein n=1 Tax=Caenispirillum salinarum AK4 TaxID=1238182 RepID=K9GRD1_9PROT|nr:DUF2141 domain-containing protein [Caenispirillum salinarum]EKV27294.1 hypothetical protein C882_1796 [Caenispirillum salinarum AK4]